MFEDIVILYSSNYRYTSEFICILESYSYTLVVHVNT